MVSGEGAVFLPVPLASQKGREIVVRNGIPLSVQGELPCEMCGAPVVASHCKRICLRCGFMTGCSEGI
jgi:hypothetical protein